MPADQRHPHHRSSEVSFRSVIEHRDARIRVAGISEAVLSSGSAAETMTGLPATSQPASSFLHGLTMFLAALASAIFVVTDDDSNRSGSAVALQIFTEISVMLGAAYALRRPGVFHRSQSLLMPLMVCMTLAAILWEPLRRLIFGTGRPFEMMIMNSQKVLMLSVAAAGCWSRYQRLAVVIGMAIAILCAAITTSQSVQWMIAVFGFAGVSWLVASHWETLRLRLRSDDSRRLPLRWLIIGPAIPLLLLFVTAAGGNNSLRSMRGFLPGSGGEDDFDPFSRGGVRDGDALVAGAENIQSFAPIEDAPFADDNKPSLYDVVNDQFDEPVRKNRHNERAIALGPELMAEMQASQMARTREAGREFSTLRKADQKKKERPKDLESRALFYVAGRTPLHLRMETYDIFDGVDWLAEMESVDVKRGLWMTKIAGKPWVKMPTHFDHQNLRIYSSPETHAVKVINLRSPVIPAPLELRGMHIDRVDDLSMFGWHSPSIPRMTRKALPEFTTIHLLTQSVHRDRLQDHPDLSFQSVGLARTLQLPEMAEIRKIADLARAWTAGIPFGYAQVDAICSRLRGQYVLDRTVLPPEDHVCPVSHFLFESRRGPDYQFATAATLMLRSLGYSARMVSGFYVSPSNFDPRKQHTPVLSKDVHFWCEVFAGGSTWITMEVCPGYDVLLPPPTLWSRLLRIAGGFGASAIEHWAVTLLLVASLIGVCMQRHAIADLALTVFWAASRRVSSKTTLLRTSRLLDWRLRRAGLRRPTGVTQSRWFRQPEMIAACAALPEFQRLTDLAAFGRAEQLQAIPDASIHECCARVRAALSLKRCRQLRQTILPTVSSPDETSAGEACSTKNRLESYSQFISDVTIRSREKAFTHVDC